MIHFGTSQDPVDRPLTGAGVCVEGTRKYTEIFEVDLARNEVLWNTEINVNDCYTSYKSLRVGNDWLGYIK